MQIVTVFLTPTVKLQLTATIYSITFTVPARVRVIPRRTGVPKLIGDVGTLTKAICTLGQPRILNVP
jgi:hypothetical protein